ncbi:DksA-like zinc-finger protein [Acinetobacter phage 133]|uniref:Conserved hypothetical bacterial protein n=1 Tax=Acinetobacter phage 133 TaxID=2919552 RepID=D9I650_9CAUD|nr:DksA-like zinc-finger protein [Acinetobacter phage 133]ADJ19431.1 conserved hypothetical bacterial protein [Acinetobacter phage 133]
MNGWGPSDPVFETMTSTINDAIDWARLDLELKESKPTETHCLDCDNEIPAGRRLAVKGVQYCVSCQSDHDTKHVSYYNRRGSKDSQLR